MPVTFNALLHSYPAESPEGGETSKSMNVIFGQGTAELHASSTTVKTLETDRRQDIEEVRHTRSFVGSASPVLPGNVAELVLRGKISTLGTIGLIELCGTVNLREGDVDQVDVSGVA